MDARLSAPKRRLLSDESRAAVEDKRADLEAARDAGDAKAAEALKSALMPSGYERVIPGALLYWEIGCDAYSALDADVFNTVLGAWLTDAWVGGRSRTGHGKLAPVIGDASTSTDADRWTGLGADGVGEIFREHMRGHSEDLRAFLRTVGK